MLVAVAVMAMEVLAQAALVVEVRVCPQEQLILGVGVEVVTPGPMVLLVDREL
jgi:hypothetical protein